MHIAFAGLCIHGDAQPYLDLPPPRFLTAPPDFLIATSGGLSAR